MFPSLVVDVDAYDNFAVSLSISYSIDTSGDAGTPALVLTAGELTARGERAPDCVINPMPGPCEGIERTDLEHGELAPDN